MKNYNEYENYELAKQDLLNEITSLVLNTEVESKKYGHGIIKDATDLKFDMKTSDVIISIKFDSVDTNKDFMLKASLNAPQPLTTSFDNAKVIELVDNLYIGWKEEADQIAAEKKAEEERLAQEKAEQVRLEKLKIKFENQKRNNLNAGCQLENSKLRTSGDDFYASLGYIAKHAKRISAAMPDYMEGWFTKNFGPDAEKRVVDSTKVGPAGYTSQWNLSMQITLDTNDNIPASLRKYLGKTKDEIQPISDTEFVFDVVRDYGFDFGKKQDLDKILENIPEQSLESFRFGYNL